jgi:Flp pilus assembly protein TadD/O-antigen ligase
MRLAGMNCDSPENRRAGILTNALLIAAVCLLALIRDPWALDSGKVPRLLALYIILAAFFVLMFVPALRKCLDWSAARHKVLLAFAAYSAAVWVSLFQAGNVSAGLIDACRSSATFLVLGLAVVCFRSFGGWRESVAKAGIVAAICAGILGDYQAAHAHPTFPSRYAMQGITGLMGNVNLFAGYLMLLLPICILGSAILRGWWKIIGVVCALHTAYLLILLQTRSAWLGSAFCVAVFVSVACLRPAAFGWGPRLRSWIAVSVAIVALALGVFFFFASPDNRFVSRARAAFSNNIGVADGGRQMIWAETLQIGLRHFPLGVGAGNFALKLHSTPGGGGVDFSKIDREWNQPHNDFLWVFAEKGVLGLLAFLLIFFWAFAAGLRSIRHARSPSVAWAACAAMAGLSAYLVDSFFSFPLDRVNHQVLLALLLAMLVADDRNAESEECEISNRVPRASFAVSMLVVGLLIAAGLTISIASLRQEWLVAEAREAMRRSDWALMQSRSRMAATPLRTLDTYSVPVAFLEGFALMKMGYDDKAIDCFRKARRENPDKFYILNNLGILLNDRGDYDEATALFIQAINLYPERTEALHNLSVTLFDQKRFEEAADVLLELPLEKRDSNIASALANAIRERNKARLLTPEPEEEDEQNTLWDKGSEIFSW